MRRQLLGELGTGSTTQGWHQDSASWRDEAVTDAPKMPPFKQVRGRSFPGRV